MAVVSWTYGSQAFYVNITTPTSITASGSTTTLTLPSLSLRGGDTQAPTSTKKWYAIGGYYDGSTFVVSGYKAEIDRSDGGQVYFGLACRTTTKVTENTYSTATWVSTPTVNTSKIFGSFNRNSKTEPLKIALNANYGGWYGDGGSGGASIPNSSRVILATINVTLNAPPTVSYDPPIYNNPQYSGLGAYSVNVIEAEAQYSGYVSSMTLTVGTDSVTQTYASTTVTNQTLSVIPTVAGTYTPTLTVTDTRGQTTTTTFPQITVNPYNSPSLDFDVFRSDNNGLKDDEGAYGLVTANVSFTDAVADITEPTVQINGTTTSNVTWYSAYNSSTGVSSAISDWSTVSSGDAIYGLINGSFSQTDSYQITITLEDSLGGESSAISQTLSTAFYTIDFQAGGKEITFGGPANDDLTDHPDGLFKCNMDALLIGPTTEVENPYYSLDTTASSGTTDGDLYAAITALSWQIDNPLNVKKLLTEILTDIADIKTVQDTHGRLRSNSTMSLTTSAQKVPLTSFSGSGCSLSSNGIKVSEAGTYVISGNIYFSTGFTANDIVHAFLYVNSTSVFEGMLRLNVANYYSTFTVGPTIQTLNANDVVYLYAYNQGGARGAVGNSDGISLWRIG